MIQIECKFCMDIININNSSILACTETRSESELQGSFGQQEWTGTMGTTGARPTDAQMYKVKVHRTEPNTLKWKFLILPLCTIFVTLLTPAFPCFGVCAWLKSLGFNSPGKLWYCVTPDEVMCCHKMSFCYFSFSMTCSHSLTVWSAVL